jgi:chondroitin AC lyase
MGFKQAQVFLLLSLFSLAHASSLQDDFNTVKQRARESFCWPTNATIATVVSQALSFQALANSTCYFPDVNYTDRSRANWLTFTHITRVNTMTQALMYPWSSLFMDQTLNQTVHCTLGVWLNNDWTSDNWWYQWIGVELQLQEIYLMLTYTNNTSPFEEQAMIEASYNSAWWVNDWSGGANLVWMIQVELMRGLASNNYSAVMQGFTAMWADVSLKSPTQNGQGIMPDHSYHFHGEQILSFSYGADYLSDILLFFRVAVGTVYSLPANTIDLLASFMAEGNAHLTFGNYFDYNLVGRNVDRPSSLQTYYVGTDTYATRLIASLASDPVVQQHLYAYADRIDVLPNATRLVGARYFWTSDFFSFHRPTWGATVRMHGNNTFWTVISNECDNSENLLAELTAQGILNVYGNLDPDMVGQEYFTANTDNAIFPLWNWTSINGATTEADQPLEPCENSVWAEIQTNFVGGTDDGLYGLVAMDTATHNLTAHRSWYFFDDIIVALGSNITDPKHVNVKTALASRIIPIATDMSGTGLLSIMWNNGTFLPSLSDGLYQFRAGEVRAFAAGGNTYVPFYPDEENAVTPSPLVVELGSKSASWTDIGPFTGQSTARVLAATIDHGFGPMLGAGYTYMIYPNTTNPLSAYDQVPVECVVNNANVQGVSDARNSISMITFWAPGTYSCISKMVPSYSVTISSTSAAIVLVRMDSMFVNVTASHPFLINSAITISVDRHAQGNNCNAITADETLFNVQLPTNSDYVGQPVTVSCSM